MKTSGRVFTCAYSPGFSRKNIAAFTIVELVLVITIIGIAFTLVAYRAGTFELWKERDFVRSFSETIEFLHHQAVADQEFYELQLDLDKNTWQVGVLKNEENTSEDLKDMAAEAGNLSLELASFLSPSIGQTQTFIPPPGFPSLADKRNLPGRLEFEDVRTMRGLFSKKTGIKVQDSVPYILFSPAGFSEFAVIHIRAPGDKFTTILVNPFTGLTQIFNEYKDFQWNYSGEDQKAPA